MLKVGVLLCVVLLTMCLSSAKIDFLQLQRMNTADLLSNYKPSSPEEIGYQALMLDFLRLHDNVYSRSCHLGHFTASAWILNNTHDHVLMMHHVKLNKWLQLGGHCDENPNCIAVAMTEAQEESGLAEVQLLSSNIFDIDIHLIPARKNEQTHYHYDVRFLLQADSNAAISKNHESHALAWVPLGAVHQKTTERSITRMVEKTVALNGYHQNQTLAAHLSK